MGNFNEYQQGTPDLGKNYWQEFKTQGNAENSSVNNIVEMNCKTIFSPDDLKNITTFNPSIFNEQ
mgnify:CR=1 FL=1